MKLKYKFIIRSVAGNSVALAVGDDNQKFNGMIKLNSVGEFIFKLLEKEITLDGIISEITNKYDVSAEDAKEATLPFIDTLRQNGVIEE